jgi:hypothetical protein
MLLLISRNILGYIDVRDYLQCVKNMKRSWGQLMGIRRVVAGRWNGEGRGRLPEKTRGLAIQARLCQITLLNQRGFQRQVSMAYPSASGHRGNFLAAGHQLRHGPCMRG